VIPMSINSFFSRSRPIWLRFCSRLIGVIVLALLQLARAGGPRYVAGITYFNKGTAGVPLTWAQGAINYYTDQGSLSATVSGAQGDALVADAFSQWTSIPTAAVTATRAGQLAEDVSGANVYRNSDGSLTTATVMAHSPCPPTSFRRLLVLR
jgi:hypothetical protein